MTTSPSSSAQAAREGVAGRLRDLRTGAGLTVTELAAGCGWHHAKTSRIENARTAPSTGDIRRWCRAVGAEALAEDLIAQSLHAESMYTEWRHQIRHGLKQLQTGSVAFFRQTELFRVYSSSLVPGLLQTEGYAAAVLGMSARFRELPVDDSAEAARPRRPLPRHPRAGPPLRPPHRGGRTPLPNIGDADAMAAQLWYLLTAGALPAVSLGVIPSTEHREQWPRETFHVYDNSLVSVELISARVRITQPSEIALYAKAFEELRQTAVYGAAARTLIVKAIDSLG
ncbi:Scr1 family TA system antitoxin-like transcriptional regulator [Streptomyces sp. ID03-2B]|uniref:Scr1 family TA system antitoxin-like transcriptional regulator n=1 Tax=Streptomyces sp. ID03-2B TaxID=3028660 RepID=UPI0029B18581|nr:Scr1 family TA system antitoxin-like transcriptional regulator [Streptomyces sp. ID03-2B]MDX3590540.1 Scr1 family TA system antitoxin-like transcriptional regulator [Streptomyces sp. ID03-2B]